MQAISLLLTLQQSGLQADDIAFNTEARLEGADAPIMRFSSLTEPTIALLAYYWFGMSNVHCKGKQDMDL